MKGSEAFTVFRQAIEKRIDRMKQLGIGPDNEQTHKALTEIRRATNDTITALREMEAKEQP